MSKEKSQDKKEIDTSWTDESPGLIERIAVFIWHKLLKNPLGAVGGILLVIGLFLVICALAIPVQFAGPYLTPDADLYWITDICNQLTNAGKDGKFLVISPEGTMSFESAGIAISGIHWDMFSLNALAKSQGGAETFGNTHEWTVWHQIYVSTTTGISGFALIFIGLFIVIIHEIQFMYRGWVKCDAKKTKFKKKYKAAQKELDALKAKTSKK